MRNALEKDDYETIRKLGHDMKRIGEGCGFDAITDTGQDLEEAAKANATAVIRETLEALSSYLEQVEIVYG